MAIDFTEKYTKNIQFILLENNYRCRKIIFYYKRLLHLDAFRKTTAFTAEKIVKKSRITNYLRKSDAKNTLRRNSKLRLLN